MGSFQLKSSLFNMLLNHVPRITSRAVIRDTHSIRDCLKRKLLRVTSDEETESMGVIVAVKQSFCRFACCLPDGMFSLCVAMAIISGLAGRTTLFHRILTVNTSSFSIRRTLDLIRRDPFLGWDTQWSNCELPVRRRGFRASNR